MTTLLIQQVTYAAIHPEISRRYSTIQETLGKQREAIIYKGTIGNIALDKYVDQKGATLEMKELLEKALNGQLIHPETKEKVIHTNINLTQMMVMYSTLMANYLLILSAKNEKFALSDLDNFNLKIKGENFKDLAAIFIPQKIGDNEINLLTNYDLKKDGDNYIISFKKIFYQGVMLRHHFSHEDRKKGFFDAVKYITLQQLLFSYDEIRKYKGEKEIYFPFKQSSNPELGSLEMLPLILDENERTEHISSRYLQFVKHFPFFDKDQFKEDDFQTAFWIWLGENPLNSKLFASRDFVYKLTEIIVETIEVSEKEKDTLREFLEFNLEDTLQMAESSEYLKYAVSIAQTKSLELSDLSKEALPSDLKEIIITSKINAIFEILEGHAYEVTTPGKDEKVHIPYINKENVDKISELLDQRAQELRSEISDTLLVPIIDQGLSSEAFNLGNKFKASYFSILRQASDEIIQKQDNQKIADLIETDIVDMKKFQFLIAPYLNNNLLSHVSRDMAKQILGQQDYMGAFGEYKKILEKKGTSEYIDSAISELEDIISLFKFDNNFEKNPTVKEMDFNEETLKAYYQIDIAEILSNFPILNNQIDLPNDMVMKKRKEIKQEKKKTVELDEAYLFEVLSYEGLTREQKVKAVEIVMEKSEKTIKEHIEAVKNAKKIEDISYIVQYSGALKHLLQMAPAMAFENRQFLIDYLRMSVGEKVWDTYMNTYVMWGFQVSIILHVVPMLTKNFKMMMPLTLFLRRIDQALLPYVTGFMFSANYPFVYDLAHEFWKSAVTDRLEKNDINDLSIAALNSQFALFNQNDAQVREQQYNAELLNFISTAVFLLAFALGIPIVAGAANKFKMRKYSKPQRYDLKLSKIKSLKDVKWSKLMPIETIKEIGKHFKKNEDPDRPLVPLMTLLNPFRIIKAPFETVFVDFPKLLKTSSYQLREHNRLYDVFSVIGFKGNTFSWDPSIIADMARIRKKEYAKLFKTLKKDFSILLHNNKASNDIDRIIQVDIARAEILTALDSAYKVYPKSFKKFAKENKIDLKSFEEFLSKYNEYQSKSLLAMKQTKNGELAIVKDIENNKSPKNESVKTIETSELNKLEDEVTNAFETHIEGILASEKFLNEQIKRAKDEVYTIIEKQYKSSELKLEYLTHDFAILGIKPTWNVYKINDAFTELEQLYRSGNLTRNQFHKVEHALSKISEEYRSTMNFTRNTQENLDAEIMRARNAGATEQEIETLKLFNFSRKDNNSTYGQLIYQDLLSSIWTGNPRQLLKKIPRDENLSFIDKLKNVFKADENKKIKDTDTIFDDWEMRKGKQLSLIGDEYKLTRRETYERAAGLKRVISEKVMDDGSVYETLEIIRTIPTRPDFRALEDFVFNKTFKEYFRKSKYTEEELKQTVNERAYPKKDIDEEEIK